MGTPPISRRTLRGRRVDWSRAGMTPRIFTPLGYQKALGAGGQPSAPTIRGGEALLRVFLAPGPDPGAAQARVQDVSQRVAEHVEAEDGEGNGQAGEDGHPGRALHVGAPGAREHGAPRGSRGRDAEPEEGQRG